MVQRDHRGDPIGKEFIDQAAVVLDARLVDEVNCAVRQNPRPGQREPIHVHAQLLDHLDIATPLMVAVACHVPAGTVCDKFRTLVGQSVPRGLTLAVRVPAPLDLVRRSSDAEAELRWE